MEYIGKIKNDELFRTDIKSPLFICGAGFWGKWLLRYITGLNISVDQILFCENNKELTGTSMNGCMIISYQESLAYEQAVYCVMGNYDVEMAQQLIDMGVKHIHLYMPQIEL